jgi:NAD(P)-dependent dehydrogenase (short-subunit alcohol dehydrogenase family)
MAQRTALITGASSGIGLAIARALGQEGYGLTISARTPEKLEGAVEGLTNEGIEPHWLPANMANEEDISSLVDGHSKRFGRLDVLVNNAGIGIGGEIAQQQTKHIDLQIGVNLRAVYLTTRNCIPMLKQAGSEHGKALVVNVASIAGKAGQPWLAAYSATKAGVVGLSQAAHGELSNSGIQVTALCPAFVATAMTDWVEGLDKEEMIQPEDIAESVRFLLRTSPNCIVPEIQFLRPGEQVGSEA